MRMEPTESSETSAINVTWTPETYPKDNKLQLEHGESLKSSYTVYLFLETAVNVSGDISIHLQEHTQMYLQHLALVKL